MVDGGGILGQSVHRRASNGRDHHHGWRLVRAYQRRRKPFGGNHMSQSIPMRDGTD